MSVASVTEVITPLLTSLNITLVGVELIRGEGTRTVVRVYIDQSSGVTIDTCAMVGHHVDALLAVEGVFASPVTLEVSSPGLERPFFALEQCMPFVEKTIHVVLHYLTQDRRKITGLLAAVDTDNDSLAIIDAGVTYIIPWQAVKKAHLVYTQ